MARNSRINTRKLKTAIEAVDARRIALQGLANLSEDAVAVIHRAVAEGDTRIAQWVLSQLLELDAFATAAKRQESAGAITLPTDPAARTQALEGLRLIKQAERRSS
jgi:hypothetical protein